MALVIAFVAAVTSGETPLNVIQLLWVNLIMDALGALGKLAACSSKKKLFAQCLAKPWLSASHMRSVHLCCFAQLRGMRMHSSSH